MKRNWKIVLGIVGGLMVVLVIVWISPLGRYLLTEGFNFKRPFDQQQWSAARPNEPATMRTRLLMLEDLLENHLKTGMDSLAIKEILGEPEREYGFSYRLGKLTEGMDRVYLILDFDGAGKVTRFNVKSGTKKAQAVTIIKE